MVAMWFSAYASYVLGDFSVVPVDVIANNVTVTEISVVQTIYTVPALLYFLIGMAGLATFNLFAAIFAYFNELERDDEDMFKEENSDYSRRQWDEKV